VGPGIFGGDVSASARAASTARGGFAGRFGTGWRLTLIRAAMGRGSDAMNGYAPAQLCACRTLLVALSA
jgi:hypothetical protein